MEEEIDSDFELSLSVNLDDISVFKIEGKMRLIKKTTDSEFMSIQFTSVFQSDNKGLEVSFEDMEKDVTLTIINVIVEQIAPVVEVVTSKSFEKSISIEDAKLEFK